MSDKVITVVAAICLYSTGHLVGGTACLLVTLLVYLRDKRWAKQTAKIVSEGKLE